MGTHVVKVPDVGEGIAEVELVSWSVAVGDSVRRNQILAEVMTDKANVEIPAPLDGVIAALNGEIGGTLAVGTPMIEMTVAGDVPPGAGLDTGDVPPSTGGAATVAAPSRGGAATAAPPRPVAEPSPAIAAPAGRHAVDVGWGPPRAEGERPLASPAVRHRARQGGIDLRRVPGTGPAGRITHEDLDAYWHAAAGGAEGRARPIAGRRPRRAPDQGVTEEPIIGIRRRIAEAMVASSRSIPHITYVEEVDVTALEDLRAVLNEGTADEAGARLTLLPFLIRALVINLADFPRMNAHVDDEAGVLRIHGGVHVGIATQTPNGLVVPVVRHAETASIWSLATQVNDLAEVARSGRATPADLSGSTITITSLGPLGGVVTTPIINKPEVAIIGVNKIAIRPTYVGDAIVPRKLMNLSSSFDHRIIDGWDAASFIQRVRRSLEQPALLFMDES